MMDFRKWFFGEDELPDWMYVFPLLLALLALIAMGLLFWS